MGASFHVFQTALGGAAIAWTGDGICAFVLPDGDQAIAAARMRRRLPGSEPRDPTQEPRDCIAQVRHYARGGAVDFDDVRLDLSSADSFDLAIYQAARSVGFGQTTTYGGLAAMAGHPGLAREAGQALGRNPLPLLVPCHRILAAGNRLGGFSAPGGAATKRRMLGLEGVSLSSPPSRQASFSF